MQSEVFLSECRILLTVLNKLGLSLDLYKKHLKCSECPFTQVNFSNQTTSQICMNHAQASIECKNLIKALGFLQNDVKIKLLKLEFNRIETFRGTQLNFNPCKLAKKGFYALRNEQNENFIKLKCAFFPYEGYLSTQSNNYETVLLDHRTLFSKCYSIQISNNSTNTESSDEQNTIINYEGGDLTLIKEILLRTPNAILHKPIHQDFAIEEERFKSFEDWPNNKIKPSQLSEAGFFFIHDKEFNCMVVKCFFCNLTISNWNKMDDPFIKHIQCNPKCSYIRQFKGSNFIDDVNESCSVNKKNLNSTSKKPVSPKSVLSRLDMRPIRKVISSGITGKSTMKKVIENALANDQNMEDLNKLVKDCVKMDEPKNDNVKLRNESVCIICKVRKRSVVYLNCSHLATCNICNNKSMSYCPICNNQIECCIHINQNRKENDSLN